MYDLVAMGPEGAQAYLAEIDRRRAAGPQFTVEPENPHGYFTALTEEEMRYQRDFGKTQEQLRAERIYQRNLAQYYETTRGVDNVGALNRMGLDVLSYAGSSSVINQGGRLVSYLGGLRHSAPGPGADFLLARGMRGVQQGANFLDRSMVGRGTMGAFDASRKAAGYVSYGGLTGPAKEAFGPLALQAFPRAVDMAEVAGLTDLSAAGQSVTDLKKKRGLISSLGTSLLAAKIGGGSMNVQDRARDAAAAQAALGPMTEEESQRYYSGQ
tara:strand:- start:305 stop:1111 length:807 start_codon:yes stop_codon:yes gene_type:complete